jgi:hypothetical protein
MENPFDSLARRIDKIESLLVSIDTKLNSFAGINDVPEVDLGDIEFASKITGLAIPTIYTKASKREIPFMKQGKKLYFSKLELLSWIKEGKKKTLSDCEKEVDSLISNLKRA